MREAVADARHPGRGAAARDTGGETQALRLLRELTIRLKEKGPEAFVFPGVAKVLRR